MDRLREGHFSSKEIYFFESLYNCQAVFHLNYIFALGLICKKVYVLQYLHWSRPFRPPVSHPFGSFESHFNIITLIWHLIASIDMFLLFYHFCWDDLSPCGPLHRARFSHQPERSTMLESGASNLFIGWQNRMSLQLRQLGIWHWICEIWRSAYGYTRVYRAFFNDSSVGPN